MKRVVCLVVVLMLLLCCGCNGFQPVAFPSFGGQNVEVKDTPETEWNTNFEDVEFVYELKRLTIDEDDIFYNNALHEQSKATVYDDQIFLYTIEGFADDKTETLHVFGADGTPIMEYAIADDSSGLMVSDS